VAGMGLMGISPRAGATAPPAPELSQNFFTWLFYFALQTVCDMQQSRCCTPMG
jgi:hypothetical protein